LQKKKVFLEGKLPNPDRFRPNEIRTKALVGREATLKGQGMGGRRTKSHRGKEGISSFFDAETPRKKARALLTEKNEKEIGSNSQKIKEKREGRKPKCEQPRCEA